ncbi:MAG: MBL fold metallo-hydrolase [Deltaproteobacteria bacterium]|nr:MBL fold metallo-hydrolase [Deltaproteobacteria bacterium]
MTSVTEIAPEIYRLSAFVPEADLHFAQFLVRDDEPLLFHTGPRAMFPLVRDALATLVDPSRLRWIGFSHFEADECGSLNQWLACAPEAQPVCSFVGAVVNVNDFATRPARPLRDREVLTTGRHQLRFLQTPHVPHCWDAGLLFDETTRMLLCSDLLHQNGDVAAVTESDVLERHRAALVAYQAGPLANYLPYTRDTSRILHALADLQPTTLATMHGTSYRGDGGAALRALAGILRELFGAP